MQSIRSWWAPWLLLGCFGCQAGAAIGATCERSSDCSAPLVCALGRCRAGCRASVDCSAGQRCLVDPPSGVGVCSIVGGDRCDTAMCPEGLVCVDGACQTACARVVACPDGVCVGAACLPIVSGSDAGIGDAASPVDASVVDAGPRCPGPHCDPVVQVANNGRSCARTASGAIWCWGACGFGICSAPGVTFDATCNLCSPGPVQAMNELGMPFIDAIDVAVGDLFTCVVRGPAGGPGTVWCWGTFSLVLPATTLVPAPVQIPTSTGMAPLDHVVDIASGTDRICAQRDSGEVRCWGSGRSGALGTGMAVDSSTPAIATELAGTHGFSFVYDATLAIDATGNVIGVGNDAARVLGGASPDGGDVALHAVRNAFGLPARALTNIGTAACAIFDDPTQPEGRIGCWGNPGYHFLFGHQTLSSPVTCASDPTTCCAAPTFLPTPTVDRWVGLSMGVDGVLWAWSASGQLLEWTQSDAPQTFMPIEASAGLMRSVASAFVLDGFPSGLCVITTDGEVLCRGADDNGQLGRGYLFFDAYDLYLTPLGWP